MSEPYFTCPSCGSPYFGRDTAKRNGVPVSLKTVKCHGSSSGPIIYGDHLGQCPWRGVWPVVDQEAGAAGGERA